MTVAGLRIKIDKSLASAKLALGLVKTYVGLNDNVDNDFEIFQEDLKDTFSGTKSYVWFLVSVFFRVNS